MITMSARLPRAGLLIAGRHLRVLRMRPGRLIYPLVQPIVLLVLFVSVLGNLTLARQGAGGSYRQFLIPGILVQNAALTAPVTGLALIRDADSGLADRFRSLPMPRGAVIVGRLASDVIVFTVQAVLLLAVASLLGFRVRTGPVGMVAIVAEVVAFGVAVAVTSSWLALLIRDAETAERVLFLPSIFIAFVSSAFAPADRLAGWLRPVARVSPVTAAADLARSLAAGGPVAGPLTHLLGWVAALTVLPGVLAARRWQASS